MLRRINGVEEPIITEARATRAGMIAAAKTMIKQLHWADFETMIDLIFARGGWQRVSVLGGTMADVDMILEQTTLGETASVQAKSTAGQAELDEFVEYFRSAGLQQRAFFVCHSLRCNFSVVADPRVRVWTGDALATVAVKTGLFDWLMEHSA